MYKGIDLVIIRGKPGSVHCTNVTFDVGSFVGGELTESSIEDTSVGLPLAVKVK